MSPGEMDIIGPDGGPNNDVLGPNIDEVQDNNVRLNTLLFSFGFKYSILLSNISFQGDLVYLREFQHPNDINRLVIL